MNETVRVAVDEVKPHPDNARVGDVNAIARSLERFGQMKPIVVQRSTGFVVAGNHTLKAAVQLGWQHLDAYVLDLDDKSARAYLVTDNMTSDKAQYDTERKEALYGELMGDETLEYMGIREEYESLREERLGKKEQKRGGGTPEKIELETGDEVPDAPEPTRSVPLLLPVSGMGEFSQKVQDLQELWGGRTLTDIVLRAVNEAHERWQAGAGKTGSAQALPELVKTEF